MANEKTTSKNWAGSGADVVRCKNPKCDNPYQDARYGDKMRVMNRCAKGGKDEKARRCTACGEVTVGK